MTITDWTILILTGSVIAASAWAIHEERRIQKWIEKQAGAKKDDKP